MEYLHREDAYELGDHYIRHISAMAEEGLYDKPEIACELAWRDQEIERLRALLAEAREEGAKVYIVHADR